MAERNAGWEEIFNRCKTCLYEKDGYCTPPLGVWDNEKRDLVPSAKIKDMDNARGCGGLWAPKQEYVDKSLIIQEPKMEYAEKIIFVEDE